MQYVRLGKSGVKVSRICLGTAFRALWKGHIDESTCIKNIQRAVDLGCNFLDSANSYSEGRCEELVGKAVKIMKNRDDLILTTKVHSDIGNGPNDYGLSRFHIMREVENSLRRMGIDHIDLYQLHRYSLETPLEETFSAMNDLVRQGKVRYVGVCNFSAANVMEALWAAEKVGLQTFVSLQNHYNLLYRWEVEPELFPLCREHGLGMMTYSPLAVGLLSGGFRRGEKPIKSSPWATHHQIQGNLNQALSEGRDSVIAKVVELSKGHGVAPSQIATAWILDHPEVTSPIIGPDLPEHVEEAFGSLDVQLTEEERRSLDELSQWVTPTRYLGGPSPAVPLVAAKPG